MCNNNLCNINLFQTRFYSTTPFFELTWQRGFNEYVFVLYIQAFVPVREVPKYYAHEAPLDAFAVKDRVRGA